MSSTARLFRASRVASNDHPWDNYRRFASFSKGWHVGLCAFVQLLLWIRSVPVSNARVTLASAWPNNEKHRQRWHTKSATWPTQLLISIQKYKTVHILGQQTWTALVHSLPVAKTDVKKLPMMLKLWENGGRWHSGQRSAGMHSHECAQVTVKLCRRVAWVVLVICSENRLPVGNQFTSLPVTVLTSLVHSAWNRWVAAM